ncbi:hypothetical protein [Defluviicoccus vanus]|uniref:hypothetical protein n=1 Tax=Defluviicoccus vanus TaxID=111831 RepID=UPI001CBA6B44|nr:hypothetical protein [Defluviicoccus vanus]
MRNRRRQRRRRIVQGGLLITGIELDQQIAFGHLLVVGDQYGLDGAADAGTEGHDVAIDKRIVRRLKISRQPPPSAADADESQRQ